MNIQYAYKCTNQLNHQFESESTTQFNVQHTPRLTTKFNNHLYKPNSIIQISIQYMLRSINQIKQYLHIKIKYPTQHSVDPNQPPNWAFSIHSNKLSKWAFSIHPSQPAICIIHYMPRSSTRLNIQYASEWTIKLNIQYPHETPNSTFNTPNQPSNEAISPYPNETRNATFSLRPDQAPDSHPVFTKIDIRFNIQFTPIPIRSIR